MATWCRWKCGEVLAAHRPTPDLYRSSLSNAVEYRKQLRHLPRVEYPFHAARTEIRKGRFVQLGSSHPASLCQIVNHKIDELNLVSGQCFSGKESVEGPFGSFPVQTYHRPDEQS